MGWMGGWNGHLLGVVNTKLESSGAPLNQVERGLGLERTGSSSAVTGHNVTAVQQSNGHVLAIARIANNHLVIWLEAFKKSANHSRTLKGHVTHIGR